MKLGFAVPSIGQVATPEAALAVAQRAEELGYHSLWTVERLLWPVNPKTPYPATLDGSYQKNTSTPSILLTHSPSSLPARRPSSWAPAFSIFRITTRCCWPED